MVMKDKLVKTNHKAMYYFMQKVGFFFIALVTVAPLIAIPTYINLKMNASRQENVAEEVQEEKQEETDNQEEEQNYEQYAL